MAQIKGLTGLRPSPQYVTTLPSPPYDVIKKGSPLEALLQHNPDSLYHIILGPEPGKTLADFRSRGLFQEDGEPCFYVYEQTWDSERRVGVLSAVSVDAYENGNIIRHEKTFDDKVQGRIRLARETGHTIGPCFLLTRSQLTPILELAVSNSRPVYDFTTDLKGLSDLHGIATRLFRIPENTPVGAAIKQAVSQGPLYIADGHHRYHAALKNGQPHALAYIVQEARIQAYNRAITGAVPFSEIMSSLPLEPCSTFSTPPKHHFCIYHKSGSFLMKGSGFSSDPVGRLDCCRLEKMFYPSLGITPEMMFDQDRFDYFPERDLAALQSCVDDGRYDIAVALHPVSIDELMAVADAGLKNTEIVMPQKSTFFSPKVLSGLFLLRN